MNYKQCVNVIKDFEGDTDEILFKSDSIPFEGLPLHGSNKVRHCYFGSLWN